MESLVRDVRYGIRSLARLPGFTAVVLVVLALGIGGNTAIFSLVYGIVLRPLPFEESENLVFLQEWSTRFGETSVSIPDLLDWRDQNQVFERIGAVRFTAYTLIDSGEPLRVQAAQISSDLFPTLRVSPILGRLFAEGDERPGARKVAILTEGLWKRRYGGDPSVIGRSLKLDGEQFTVIGVGTDAFDVSPWGDTAELWVPIALNLDREWWRNRNSHRGTMAIARLLPGVSLERAQRDMDLIAQRLEGQYPDSNTGMHVTVYQLRERLSREVRTAMLVLLAAVGLVLLIACVNIANLQLARTTYCYREMAIRLALGAGRPRIICQRLTESMLLALMGGAIGLLVASWSSEILSSVVPGSVPRMQDVALSLPVLLFTLGISVTSGAMFGMVPAFRSTPLSLTSWLREGGRGTHGSALRGVRSALTVAEIALALVLLAGAGLLIRSFARLVNTSAGFDSSKVLTASLALPSAKYPEHSQQASFFEELIAQLDASPGVEVAGVVNPLPMRGNWQVGFAIEGQPPPERGQLPIADYAMMTPGYFQAMGIRLIRGRFFTARDREETPHVAIIDETMAAHHFPGEDPIGKRIRLGAVDSTEPWLTIVGIVGHVKSNGIRGESYVEVFQPFFQNPSRWMSVVIRTHADPAASVATLRDVVRHLDSELPIAGIRTMDDVVAASRAPDRMVLLLLGAFAALALVLATVGIYGVMSYLVAQNTREIGIRMALGAAPRTVLLEVLRQGLRLAVAGVTIGLAGAFALSRVMSTLVFDVSPTDPATFAVVSLVLLGVALLACSIPALRGARVDPLVALRAE